VTYVTHSDLLTHLTRDPLTHCHPSLLYSAKFGCIVDNSSVRVTILGSSSVFTCIEALGTPQPKGAPRYKVFTGFPLQLIFAKVKAEN